MRGGMSCFKAYDIRGRLGVDLDDAVAWRIGRAFAEHFGASRVAVGGDVRLSSEPLKRALAEGLMDGGADVLDLGLTGTEEIYFAAFHLDVDGAIEVTASHNPADYNGMKFVGRGAVPVSADSGLAALRRLVEADAFGPVRHRGSLSRGDVLAPYVEHVLGFIAPGSLRPLHVLTNAGNGAAGHALDAIAARLADWGATVKFSRIFHEPDGTFPNGIPNPLLPENRAVTSEAVRRCGADIGIAWDGDFDRCFLFDEQGECIEGYYIVGLLAEALLDKHPGEKIIHDPRLIWNTIEVVRRAGGQPIQSKTGHAFIKERMRRENAVYGGEMSAHHYFRDFGYCDSGMIPWLLVLQLMSASGEPLSSLVRHCTDAYPCSGEINFQVRDPAGAMARVERHFAPSCPARDETDGLSMDFGQWRMNLRMSNTEPLLRLNVEARGSQALVREKVEVVRGIVLESA